MGCRDDLGRYTAHPMDGRPWQVRAKEAGLSQRKLARIAGKPENTVSRQLRGEFGDEAARYLMALILAWEGMTPEQRDDWQKQIEREVY
jgi:transcriptional regulator with XRE-family HTH domain